MKPLPSRALACCAALVASLGVAALPRGAAGEDSIEVRELQAALTLARAGMEEERRRAEEAEAQRRALVESLAEAVRVSEEQLMASRETQLTLQALGVDLFTREEDSLEQRLVKAVRDLDISRQDVERRSAALHELGESFLRYLQATPDAPEDEREDARAAIEAASAVLAPSPGEEGGAGGMDRTRVVSIDSGIGLVVFDMGREAGLRVGTPVAVLRNDRPIFTALVVDVRDSIAGAVLQERLGDADEAAVGDGIRLLPNHGNF